MAATRESLGRVLVISERLADVAAFCEDIVGLPVAHREEQNRVWFRVGSIGSDRSGHWTTSSAR